MLEMDFGKLNYVGTLLFKEYPSTVVYSSERKIPVIVEWIDVNDDDVDQFFLYETSIKSLKDYIDGKKTHLELIQTAINSNVWFFDNTIHEPRNIIKSKIKDIAKEYLPSSEAYFDNRDSTDTIEILNFFQQISQIKERTTKHPGIVIRPNKEFLELREAVADYRVLSDDDKGLEVYTKRINSELLRIHLNLNKYVNHGRAQTDILANTLIGLDDLYAELVTDNFKGKDRNIKIKKAKEKNRFNSIAHTEVVLTAAKSFSVYVRPMTGQTEFDFDDSNSSFRAAGEAIFREMLDVIEKTSSSEKIDAIKNKYNSNVFDKIKILAEHIKKNDLSIDIGYYSPVTNKGWDKNIDLLAADNIINSIEKSVIKHDRKFNVIGKFTALNCKTAHFTFLTNDEDEYTGYFDELIKESMANLNFVDFYKLVVSRVETKNISDAEYKNEDKVMAVTPYTEPKNSKRK
jgi:hypothetical protein